MILHLGCGNGDKAEKSMGELAAEADCFSGTDDYECASNILAAYADKDEEALKVSIPQKPISSVLRFLWMSLLLSFSSSS